MTIPDYKLKFGLFVADTYANDMQLVQKMICNSEAYRFCLFDVHNEFVKNGSLTAVTKMDFATRREIIDRSYKWQPDKINKWHRRQICGCIWVLNFILEKYFT